MPSASQSPVKSRKRHPLAGPTAQQALENAKKASKGAKVGKPRTYSPELCEHAVMLGRKGKSWAAIARDFNISRSTLNDWVGSFPEFADALARARAAAQAWWEDHGQRNLKADRYQAQVHKTIMAAQFEDYREVRTTGLEALPDFLAAITEVATGRKIDRASAAKPVEVASSFEVVQDPVKKGE